MKKLFVSALVMCAISFSMVVNAQDAVKKESPINEGKECVAPRRDMAKELNLTPEQQAKMKAAKEEFDKARKESREEMKAAREKHRATMDEILTPEQKAKMKEMRGVRGDKKEMRHHRGHKHDMCGDSLRGGRPHGKMRGECVRGEKPCPDKKAECCKDEMSCNKGATCVKGEKPCCDKKATCDKGDKSCPR